MARGPAPKPADRRARGNKDQIPTRVIQMERTGPQDMPDDLLELGEHWHPATVRWWKRWADSAITQDWTPVDWSELEACAVLHHEFMKKRTFTLASEIRLRMAKFGATPEDRQRLRILLADADEKDEKREGKPAGGSSREKYKGLRAVAGDA